MGISAWQIIILLLIVILLFGTKKLRNMGGDLGAAVKGFKAGMKDKDDESLRSIEDSSSSTVMASNSEVFEPDIIENKPTNKSQI